MRAKSQTIGIRGNNEELPSRWADAIDDRIAEILDEMLEERNVTRPHQRLLHTLGAIILLLALTITVLLYLVT